ncbi:MAG: DNA-binding protein [Prevotella sp.]|nr:DNA-binding protein [Prevotella sp.]
MAKYMKQEMPDLNGTGKAQAYYKMLVYRNVDFGEFVERCVQHGGMQRSAIVGVLTHVCNELALTLAEGYSVTIDGLGTFGTKLGVRPDKEQDGFEEDEQKRNATSIEVNGLSFRADRGLVAGVNERCRLEPGGARRLHRSPYSIEERAQRAREFLAENGVMRTGDYAQLTGLSRTAASLELRKLCNTPDSGITSRGRKSGKVYITTDFAD